MSDPATTAQFESPFITPSIFKRLAGELEYEIREPLPVFKTGCPLCGADHVGQCARVDPRHRGPKCPLVEATP